MRNAGLNFVKIKKCESNVTLHLHNVTPQTQIIKVKLNDRFYNLIEKNFAKVTVKGLHFSVKFYLFLVTKKNVTEISQYYYPLFLPFIVNMTEEENYNEISESERVSLKFNEMLDCINDTDNTSTFSDIDFKEFEDIDEEYEICDEMDKIIDHSEQQNFTPCVIIDFIEGKFQRCEGTGKLKQLRNLLGTWQVDRNAIKEVDGVLSKLGVCDSHFQFDNKYLHQSLVSKKDKDFNEGIIQWRRCIFCNNYVTFFSRGAGCVIHSWYLNKKNIQVPCIGQYTCKALQPCPNLCNQAYGNIKRPQSICCLCYENLGGHIHHRSGIRGKSATTCITKKLHENDITKGLEFMGNLLIKIAQMDNNEIKKNIFIKIFEILFSLISNEINTDFTTTIPIPTTNTSVNYEEQEKIILDKPPTLFMIKFLFIKIFKDKEVKKNEISNYKANIFYLFFFNKIFFNYILFILIGIWTYIWTKTMGLTINY